MEDGYRLIDYGININDVVQLMVRAAPIPAPEEVKPKEEENSDQATCDSKKKKDEDESLVDTTCEYYEVKRGFYNF